MYNLKNTSRNKVESINKIISSMEELLSIDWDDDLDNEYPFEESLDEILIKVIKWKKAQIK